MFAVIKFDNANHRDNEQTDVHGPFKSADDATAYANDRCKYWHVVRMREPDIKRGYRLTVIGGE